MYGGKALVQHLLPYACFCTKSQQLFEECRNKGKMAGCETGQVYENCTLKLLLVHVCGVMHMTTDTLLT